jgi:hypothetical protein
MLTASDGAPIYVSTNGDRSDIYALSIAGDGSARALQLVTQVNGPRVVTTTTYAVRGMRVMRLVASLAPSEGKYGLGISAPDGTAPLLNLFFQVQNGRQLAVRGTHEAVLDLDHLAASPLSYWLHAATRVHAAKLSPLRPLLRRAAAHYEQRGQLAGMLAAATAHEAGAVSAGAYLAICSAGAAASLVGAGGAADPW